MDDAVEELGGQCWQQPGHPQRDDFGPPVLVDSPLEMPDPFRKQAIVPQRLFPVQPWGLAGAAPPGQGRARSVGPMRRSGRLVRSAASASQPIGPWFTKPLGSSKAEDAGHPLKGLVQNGGAHLAVGLGFRVNGHWLLSIAQEKSLRHSLSCFDGH